MGAFCCHGNQTKGQTALEEFSFESVNGQMDGQTDDRQKVITIAQPEYSSGELKINKT